jgi:Asp-tRNA(Asn)/Glu-tRNA(Gln) amidotransferase A subunit family amidase
MALGEYAQVFARQPLQFTLAPSGLPISIQLTGAALEEGRLLSIARWCEGILAFDALPPAAPL